MDEPEDTIWDPDRLGRLSFDTNRDLFDHLRIEAYKSGFDLASRQPLMSPYGAFYCKKGGRVKGGSSAKCGCTFQFKTTVKAGHIVVPIDETLELKHNHELIPRAFAHKIIPQDIKDTVRQLHSANVKPMQIKTFLEQQGHILSTLQVQYMVRSTEVASFQAETDELIDYVNEDPEALTRVFEREVDGERHRFAVLTFTKEELQHLKKFGDVIFIDGTMARLKMRWEVLPITAIDQHRGIVSCGVMYASITTEEILTWLLMEIWRILKPLDLLRTIVSDEDTAFTAAFRNLVRRMNDDEHVIVHHVLCALHKLRSFMRKMQTCGLTKLERETAVDLFRKISYHTNNDYAQHCLVELKGLNERLRRYIEENVEPELHQFARSYMNGIHTNGYNTTSPGESMNNMLKHDLRPGMTLRESREHFNRILRNHGHNAEVQRNRRRIPVETECAMPIECYQRLGRAMAAKLEKQVRLSETIEVEPLVEADDIFTHSAYSREHPEIEYKLNDSYCSCNTIRFLGIPCCHLLKLYEDNSEPFPLELIDERWILDDAPREDSGDESGSETFLFSESETSEGESELKVLVQEEDDERELPNLEPESPKELYLKLFHLGKNVASKACQSPKLARKIAARLREMLNQMIELPPDESPNDSEEVEPGEPVVDVVDHVARPRGRPRMIRNWKRAEKRKCLEEKCNICDGGHETTECYSYERWRMAMEEYRDYDGPRRRCRVCTAPGHNKRTCPIRLEALEHCMEGDRMESSEEEA